MCKDHLFCEDTDVATTIIYSPPPPHTDTTPNTTYKNHSLIIERVPLIT